MDIKAVVNWFDVQQEIDGFGVCGAFRQADNLYKYPIYLRTKVLDLLFSVKDGAGFSIVRNIIGDSGNWGNIYDGPTKSIEPYEGVYNYEGDEDQIWFMNEAKKRGCTKFISTVWSPPAWMKTNNSVNNGGELRQDKYMNFANYIVRYIKEYKSRYGIDIYAVSCANEPKLSTSYSSCLWTGEQMSWFFSEYLGPMLEKEKIDTMVFAPETEQFGNNFLMEYKSIFSDTVSIPQIAAQHGYGGVVEPIDAIIIKNRKLWLSEISDVSGKVNDPSINDGLFWAKTVHEYLTKAKVNAFIYFWGMSMYYNKGISLIGLNSEEKSVVINKRLFTIGNYSRFIRPGFKRIGVTGNLCDGVFISAYNSAKGDFVLVVVNDRNENVDITVECNGFGCSELTAYRTSENEDLKLIETLTINENSKIPVKGKSVTTFVGVCTS